MNYRRNCETASSAICLKMGFIPRESANQFSVYGVGGNGKFNQQSLKVVCSTKFILVVLLLGRGNDL